MLALKLGVLSLLGFAAAACGGSTSSTTGGSSEVSGTAGGAPALATDSIALFGTQSVGAVPVAYAGAILTNLNGTCGVLQRKGNPASATAITVLVATRNPSVALGTYPIGNIAGTNAEVGYSAESATCMTTVNEKATGGTITITHADGTTVSGSFDATFPSGDHLTGNFSSAVCAVDVTQGSSTAPCGS